MTKYGNRKTEIDGILFASALEARHYQELKLRQFAGEISKLEIQPRYLLQEGFIDPQGQRHRPIYYIADFAYMEKDRHVIVDCKGKETEAFRLKRKMFLHRHRLDDWDFRIVKA